MSPIDTLLPRLDKVRRGSRPGTWTACCPAHEDRSPSLAVRELDDGRVLLWCGAGCGAEEIVGSLGLGMEDLFPPRDPRPGAGTTRERRPFIAADLINLAAFEAGVACTVVADLAAGRVGDFDRLIEAAARLGNVAEVVHGRR
ncbi:hypothetical protein [Rubrivivax gelatinosus]|uniref:hypothetical protein n=1 Tax=Rubrivivax gelatinosus TaxID=28068 RepID=UPI0005C1C40C|nr:hypothetical protein [Rubrivivax gelatinosus]MBG6082716.1 hypothetical protein [Rubrivivax gelatinosus]